MGRLAPGPAHPLSLRPHPKAQNPSLPRLPAPLPIPGCPSTTSPKAPGHTHTLRAPDRLPHQPRSTGWVGCPPAPDHWVASGSPPFPPSPGELGGAAPATPSPSRPSPSPSPAGFPKEEQPACLDWGQLPAAEGGGLGRCMDRATRGSLRRYSLPRLLYASSMDWSGSNFQPLDLVLPFSTRLESPLIASLFSL